MSGLYSGQLRTCRTGMMKMLSNYWEAARNVPGAAVCFPMAVWPMHHKQAHLCHQRMLKGLDRWSEQFQVTVSTEGSQKREVCVRVCVSVRVCVVSSTSSKGACTQPCPASLSQASDAPSPFCPQVGSQGHPTSHLSFTTISPIAQGQHAAKATF